MNTEVIIDFLQAEQRVKDLNKELKEAKALKSELESKALNELIDSEVKKITLRGRTVYIKPKIFAHNIQGKAASVEVLINAGLDDYVKRDFNQQSLNAYVRELVMSDQELPPEFEGYIEPFEKFTVSSTKS